MAAGSTEVKEFEDTTARETPPVARWSRSLVLEIAELGLILIGAIAAIYWLPVRGFYDGNVREAALNALMLHGQLSNMDYSMIGPIFSIPNWLLDRLFDPQSGWWVGKFNVFLTFIILPGTYFLLRKRMDAGVLRKFILILLIASMFGNLMTYYGGEVFTALLVGMGTLIAYLLWKRVGWIAVALGVANTPASLVGLGTLLLGQIALNKRLRYMLVGVLAVGFVAADNWIFHGSPVNGGYQGQGFNTPFLQGLISIFFAFGKGLIFFLPGLFLPVKKYIFSLDGGNQEKLYQVYLLWISFIVGLVLVYASWWAWDGGWTWGPRFFLFASIPASFVLAARLHKSGTSFLANLLTLLILGYALYVGINGVIMDISLGDLNSICAPNNYAAGYLCNYDPLYSPLWHPFVVHTIGNLLKHQWKYVLYSVVVFVYLAVPLVRTMAKQAVGPLEELDRKVFSIRL
jgi:hypothetical protein